MNENISKETVFLEMLETVVETKPYAVVLSKDLFDEIDEESLLYALGHFYISVKDFLSPFCPFYLHKTLPDNTFIMTETSMECDKLLLDLNYKTKGKISMEHQDDFKVSTFELKGKFVYTAGVKALLQKIAKTFYELCESSDEMESFVKNQVDEWLGEL